MNHETPIMWTALVLTTAGAAGAFLRRRAHASATGPVSASTSKPAGPNLRLVATPRSEDSCYPSIRAAER